ncbi:AAA family ATPase [Flavobacterium branchiarum]|uniref:ATP-dependent endonuclease n=1 Tax=Flavobacterium branchiarum TaxID=1114870 RepID=A0ABV5FIM9_9FLAO|nr:AAA family ATPase [Flavobacterium branchiarum]MDN3675083.1 AAA family ATPase [Flavobacterium branchiarum]
MYLSELKLWNFRKYGSETFDLNKPDLVMPFIKGLNLLIGENDSGKSAILDAIKLVLKTHAYEWIKVDDSDFYVDSNNHKSEKLRIEIHFSDISNDEAKNFIEWCGWAEEVKGDGKMRPKLILIYQAEIRDNRIIPSDVKAGMDGVGHLLNAEAREYLKCTYLKALRDADSELTAKKNSRLSQILQQHDLFKKKKKIPPHYLEDVFNKTNETVKKYFNNDEKVEGRGSNKELISNPINSFLQKFVNSDFQSKFDLNTPDIKNILEKISLGIEGKDNLGLGTMNRLFMAAELLHLERKNWSGLRLCMIEELEAHLHPQAQMKIIEALIEESDKGVQFILTTHSPNIASKVDLKSLIICKNNDAFPMGEENTKLNKDDYIYLERFLDVTKSNLFFAKGIVIVEGWSEEILIPEIAKKIGNDLTQREVSIINVASVAYLHFANVFLRNDDKKMKVPVAIITDLDNRPNEEGKFKKYEELDNDLDKSIKTKYDNLEKLKTDYTKTDISLELAKEWTLEWCLFNSPTLSELFKESLKNTHPTIFKQNFDDFIPMLKKEKPTNLNKVKLAANLADKIKRDKKITKVDLEKDEYLKYIILSIKHACNHGI